MQDQDTLESKTALAVIESVKESALILNKNLRVKFANKSFYKVFKVTPKQTQGKLIYGLGNRQWDIPRLRTLLEEILPGKSSFENYEIDHDFLNVGRKTMLLSARQLRGLEGETSEILLVIEDITLRKELENKLAAYTTELEKKVDKGTETIILGKAREEAILRSIGDGLIVMIDVNEGGRIAYVNQAFEKMMGWKQTEVLNKFMVDIIPREDKNGNVVPFKERIITKVLSGQAVTADINEPFYYQRKDKSKFPVASIITPILLDKKIVGAVETFRDITKESAIDKTKTEFASLVSHQLRTPFSTINWYVELLLKQKIGKLNVKQTKYLEEVYRASKRMVNLINVLLSISRIEMGISTDETEQVDVISLAEEILKERKLEMEKKKLTFKKIYGKNIPQISADPQQITMIFQNLLSNAIKYTPVAGKITLNIKVERDDLLISITDTGIGIPKKAEAKIFSRFFRADNAKENEAEGTGLGLYILKAIVDQMGGKTWFKSEEGEGATFYISLPIKKVMYEGSI